MAMNEVTGVTGTGRSAWETLLKTVYGPLWQLHVHTKVVIWSMIMNPKGRMGGKAILSAVINSLPQSAGIALFEDDNLPTPQTLTAFRPETHVKDLYTRLRVTGNVMRAASGGNQEAWATPLQTQLKHAREQWMLNLARKAYLGPYDNLSRVAEAFESDGENVITLQPRTAKTSAAASWWNFGAHYMRQNQSIYWTAANDADGDPAGTQPAFGDTGAGGEIIISSIDKSDETQPRITIRVGGPAGSLTTDPTTVPALGAYIFPLRSRKNDVADADVTTKESDYATFNGLANIVEDGTKYDALYALGRATYPTLCGQRSTNGGVNRTWSELLLALLIDNVSDDGTGTEPDTAVLHRSVRREVVKENRALRQFPVIQTESGAGHLTFQSGDTRIPYITDRDCPPGLVYVLDTEMFGWLSNSNMGPLETGERRFVNNKDAMEVNMHMSGQSFSQAPYANGVLEDLSFLISAI